MKPRRVNTTDLQKRFESLWDRGMPPGASTGWRSLDAHYTICPGQLTVLTGWPGSGKSELLDAILVNLSRRDWRFAVFSFENQPTEIHAAKLAEKITGLPFGAGPNERIPKSSLASLAADISQSFGMFHAPAAEGVNISEVLEAATDWFNAYAGEHAGLVIDPWNELEHYRPANLSETEYISQTLSTVRNWARESKVHVWIVAHPQKVRREDGKLPIVRPDMISGSQHWWNKADCAISVWRDMENPDNPEIEVHVQKVRFKHIGRPGLVPMRYDRITGRYYEAEPQWVGASIRVA
jgi:twinkle protein